MSVIDPEVASAGLVARAKAILLTPKSEWNVIAAESATIPAILKGYVAILAAVPVISGLIGGQIFGHGMLGVTYRPGLVSAVVGGVVAYGLAIASVYILAFIIDALAPSFDGVKDRVGAFKVAAYAGTAGWVGGAFTLFPPLSILAMLAGLYGLYLLYLGLPILMKSPEQKALGYTVVTIICAIVLFFVAGAIASGVAGMAAVGGIRTADAGKISGNLQVGDAKVDLNALQSASKQLEANASGATTGTATPTVSTETLKSLLPETVTGYARTSLDAQASAAGGITVANASAEYAKGDNNFRLGVTDMGSASGLANMAGAFGVASSHDSATGYEKMGQVDGRLTTEEWNHEDKRGKYGVMVGKRFMVEADGAVASIADLKNAVASVDFGKLEALAK